MRVVQTQPTKCRSKSHGAAFEPALATKFSGDGRCHIFFVVQAKSSLLHATKFSGDGRCHDSVVHLAHKVVDLATKFSGDGRCHLGQPHGAHSSLFLATEFHGTGDATFVHRERCRP